MYSLCALATLYGPRRNLTKSRLSTRHCCLRPGGGYRLPFYKLTRLNRFTLSHCGSCAPLPTLKPNLAASAPRLSTGCSLRFARCGLKPHCLTCTELAHPHLTFKLPIMRPYAQTCSAASARLAASVDFRNFGGTRLESLVQD